MIRIYVDRPVRSGRSCPVEDEFWTHYVTTVRRLGEGDEVELAGPDRVGQAEILNLDPLTLGVDDTRPVRPPAHEFVLAQALTRKKKFEQSVKLGTELGVTAFVPVLSKRTVRAPNNPEKQLRRWKKIAVDSARIVRRDTLPEIRLPCSLEETINDLSSTMDDLLVGDVEGEPVPAVLSDDGTSTGVFVGPEGGFTAEERDRLLESGVRPVGLKAENLRAETAAVALMTLVQSHRGVI